MREKFYLRTSFGQGSGLDRYSTTRKMGIRTGLTCLTYLLLSLILFTNQSIADGPFQQDSGTDGLISIEAEHYDANVSQGGHDWTLVTTPTGFSGTGAMRATPNTNAN